MTGSPRTSIDPRSDRYRQNRDGMGALLDQLVAAHERAVHATRVARERVDALLDRDAPFLELAAPAGRVLGIGLVAGIACVVLALEVDPGEDDGGAPEVAGRNDLPCIRLDLRGDAELVLSAEAGPMRWSFPGTAEDPSTVRAAVARLAGPSAAPPPDAPPPRHDDAELRTLAPFDGAALDVRELISRLVDDAAFTEVGTGARHPDEVAGWATWCGFPVAVLAGADDAFAERCADQGLPVVRIHGPVPVFELRRAGGRGLTIAWPRPDAVPAGIDAVVDPRDTRVALGIALAVTRSR